MSSRQLLGDGVPVGDANVRMAATMAPRTYRWPCDREHAGPGETEQRDVTSLDEHDRQEPVIVALDLLEPDLSVVAVMAV